MAIVEALGADVAKLTPPRWKAPRGTVDTHFHVFGPRDKYPYLPTRTFTPQDASAAEYMQVCRMLGIDRGVLVQPSGYGADNSRHLDAVAEFPFPTRVVVTVHGDVSDKELDRMHAIGARGVRVVTIQKGGLDLSDLERLGARLGERGWHFQFLIGSDVLVELQDRLPRLGCDVVIDHFAHVTAAGGLDQPPVRALQSLIESGKGWIKLTGGYRISQMPAPHADALPLVHDLISRRPDRFVWGTDWPHVVLEGEVPDTTASFDLLLDWMPDEKVRKRILVDNPEELYGFDPYPAA
jgi:predicted TIM-barrel fold metal-dependent hydrolase